jgi:calcium-translocating P-type ATPase
MTWRAFLERAASLGAQPLSGPADDWEVLSSSEGRLRVRLPATVRTPTDLDDALRRLPRVRRIEHNSVTASLLLHFDPAATTADDLLGRLRRLTPPPPPPAPPTAADDIPVVSSSPGRLRVHLTRRRGARWRWVDAELRRLEGVSATEFRPQTGNLLILFDPARTTPAALLHELRGLLARTPPPEPDAGKNGRTARIAVRGMDRDPRLALRVIRGLERTHQVRARAHMLTGHLLVEYDHQRVLLEDLIAAVSHMELPELPEEDRPSHPLDPEPLVQGSVKAVGILLGMAVLTVRRLAAGGLAVGTGFGLAATTAGLMNLVGGFPFVRDGLRRLLGHTAGDVLASAVSVVSLTLADFPLGLIVAGTETVVFLGEVTARRAAWSRYEERLDGAASAEPGAVIRLEAGMRVPHAARVIEGTGTATARTALPLPLSPGASAPAGAVVAGGPFVLELQGGEPFEPGPRPAPPAPTFYQRYHRIIGPVSLGYALFTGARTASLMHAFEGLLLLNPRTAAIGHETANLHAAARVLRAGLTLVGTRPERDLELPGVVLLDGPRLLTDGLEIAGAVPAGATSASDLLTLAAGVNAAAGSPWAGAFPPGDYVLAEDGSFNGLWAEATVAGERCVLGPPEDDLNLSDEFLQEHQGGFLLELRILDEDRPLGYLALRPRLLPAAADLVALCGRLHVKLELLPAGSPLAAAAVARRAGLAVASVAEPVAAIHARQKTGARVAFVSDHAEAAPAFAACDLAVGFSHGRGEFPARADVLAPDLRGLGDLLEAAALRERAVRDGVFLSGVANAVGTVLGFAGPMGVERASLTVYLTALTAIGAGWWRLRGGDRPGSALAHLSDPRPERWGRLAAEEVQRAFDTREEGLTSEEAVGRRPAAPAGGSDALLLALRNQVRAPITGILAGGAALTMVLSQPLNTTILGFTISMNLVAGVWQERQIGQAAEALQEMGAATARVTRDGQVMVLPASEVVPGDVLVLAAGDRVAADARLLSATGLEVAEAALTGESLPVPKGPFEQSEGGRIVLEGSDVTVGSGRAVVVAVGRQTRLGATAAALAASPDETSPLGERLGRILQIALPVAFGGGLVTALAGLAYGGLPVQMLTIGVTTALSAIPEGLPLLAGVGQAAVARRLARERALVRRIAAVEALGRVDVTCTDKTGTLTEGRLALRLLASADEEALYPGSLPEQLQGLLLAAAMASPHPDAVDATFQPTDAAVVRAALGAGLGEPMRRRREAEVPFDSARAFRAARVAGRLYIKGAPEKVMARCTRVRRPGGDELLDEQDRAKLLARGVAFAERGLRVLLAAEGPDQPHPGDPHGLTALGFLGISDPLRPTVYPAVTRCQAAGIRIIMLTGDHPATARTIAGEAGLLTHGPAPRPGENDPRVVKAIDLADLSPEALGRRLEGVAVIARATPIDKLRIVESLRLRGHTVAMTGDGVNDAPALRLADVGVAMGKGGTEVARQASDMVLQDDDFASLVEALVEGRGFWRNMRTGLGLLLGGNIGELGLIVGANLLGYGSPLTSAQILIVNLITDALPSLAVLLQKPEHRNLAALAREGLGALDTGLRRDVFRRAVATAVPSLGTYLLMHSMAGPAQASAVAFTGVVCTQLAQTLEVGRVEGGLSESVVYAVSASVALLAASVTLPPLRNFLGLITPNPLGCGLVTCGAAGAVAVSRMFDAAVVAAEKLAEQRAAGNGVLATA